MARDDWFRNTDWTPQIEQHFFAKLSRARDKNQPLRIQASMFAQRYPEVALRLLERYFELGDHFDQGQAHVDRARAYLALGDANAAIAAYEAALARENEYPKVTTQALARLAFLDCSASYRCSVSASATAIAGAPVTSHVPSRSLPLACCSLAHLLCATPEIARSRACAPRFGFCRVRALSVSLSCHCWACRNPV